ncbi:3-methyladenine DNA glycosylase/8-oxoguanine DNA glycosylase [Psychromicrobium silvestre]|uniref:3-methyladenine DNA glycosylase/8-oxoguanine DNA glycosylase n=1 Tax=Psychromicrobium silvestre TaxID=1645614 RepID=A0A7Y9LTP0_9MICC|nr:3-methyladenine DNA glycosylase [Psychromicrobium silvestre]NYE95384.1 3-methyladenine DNA glycosylase/8-oxoguanine DNA glycosylase [Psychromicrobium silvestre]NYE95400.1 3-methyladenine DNA glycosylase/8-oxoguanine DNA glycosylase [Psychromicrobium silvestre]
MSTASEQPRELIWRAQGSYDLHATVGIVQRSSTDPCAVFHQGAWWFAFHTPLGPATLSLRQIGTEVRAQALGPGAEAALEGVPALLGAEDDWSEFDSASFQASLPAHVREARRRHPGLRLPSTGRILDSLIPLILEQKVTGKEAFSGYRRLINQYGSTPPGAQLSGFPPRLRLAPSAAVWSKIPSWHWHQAGVGPQRSDTVMRALQRASALERLGRLNATQAGAGLQSISGIGPWTAAEVTQRSHGDPDAVAVGDYHLPGFVGIALTGEAVDDDGMLELLEPWRGHRQRVVRMLYLSGISKERHGPRMSVRDYRRI